MAALYEEHGVEPRGLEFGSLLYQLCSLRQSLTFLGLSFHTQKMGWLCKFQNAQHRPWNAAT